MLKLEQYPQAIYEAEHKLNELNAAISDLLEGKLRVESEIKAKIAFDTSIKNDFQREAYIFEQLQASQGYQIFITDLPRLRPMQTEAEAVLNRLKNEFEVAKLLLNRR